MGVYTIECLAFGLYKSQEIILSGPAKALVN